MWLTFAPLNSSLIDGLAWLLAGLFVVGLGGGLWQMANQPVWPTPARLALVCAAGMLVIVPSGSGICWPLADGRYIHIGWVDATGVDTGTLAVTTHHHDQPIAGENGQKGTAPRSAAVSASPEAPLMSAALVLALPLAALWYALSDNPLGNRLRKQRPPNPPPRFA